MTAVSAVIFLVTAEYNMATTYIVGRVEAGEFGLAIAYSSVLIVVMLVAIVLIQLAVGERRLGRRAAPPGRPPSPCRRLLIDHEERHAPGIPHHDLPRRHPPPSEAGRVGRIPQRDEALRRRDGGRRRVLHHRARHARHAARPLRLRQDHDAAHDRRARDGERGPDPHRRARRDPPVGRRPRRQHGVPVLRAVPAHDGARERRLRPSVQGRSRKERGGDGAWRSSALVGLSGLEQRVAVRTVGRAAAARRGGARAGAGAAGAAVRRAAVEPRRQAAPPRARGHPRTAAIPQPHRRLRDARPGGGAGRLRPHHRDVERPHRPDRHAARALRGAGRPVRGRLHRRRQHPRRRTRRDDRPRCGRVRIGDLTIDLPHRGAAGAPSSSRCAPTPFSWTRARRAGSVSPAPSRKASYLGTQVEYDVDTALGELFVVRYGSPDIIPPGTPVSITLAIRRGVAIIPGA